MAVKKKKVTKKKDDMVSGKACMMCGRPGCHCWVFFCALSTTAFFFALMNLIPAFGGFVGRISWWVWLVVSIVLGWKPLMAWMK